MLLLDRLAEEKIRTAADDGAFDNLPGEGQPLTLDDDRMVPEELRAGYRLLKNSGFLPPEIEQQRELRSVEQLLATSGIDDDSRARARKRLALLQAQLGESRLGRALHLHEDYRQRILSQLDHNARD